MAQLVERVLGKDEVPGSNPGSSSKKKSRKRLFLFVLQIREKKEMIRDIKASRNERKAYESV